MLALERGSRRGCGGSAAMWRFIWHTDTMLRLVWRVPRSGWRSIPSSMRHFQTENLASDAFTKTSANHAERLTKSKRFIAALSPADRRVVASMLRVDHAGEIAANTIYEAQADVFGFLGKQATKKLMLEMWDNERKHLASACAMLDEYNTRPSALTPVWALAGRILGGATALMGEKSAMACTEAVETVIGEHYDEYVHYELTFSASCFIWSTLEKRCRANTKASKLKSLKRFLRSYVMS